MSFAKITKTCVTLLILSRCIQGSTISNDLLKTDNETSKFRNVLSDEIRKYMNESVDPCENFYEFVCGNWKQYYPANSSVPFTSMHSNVYDVFKSEIMEFLSTIDENDTESDRKVKNFYGTCTETNFKERVDRADILKEIIGEFGQMPALAGDNWKEDDFDWLKTVAEISNKYDIHIIIGFDIYASSRQATDIVMRCPLRTSDLKEAKEKAYGVFKKYLLLNESESLELATEISNFEQALWNISIAARIAGTKSVYFESFLKEYSNNLNVVSFVNTTFGYIPNDIKVFRPLYTKALGGIEKKFPKKVVANYIFYKLISEIVKDFNTECYDLMDKYFKIHLSNMYYRLRNASTTEHNWQLMWSSIKTTLQMILESKRLSWLDDDSIEYFLEKLHSMQMEIATFKDDNLDEIYARLTISENDYIENMKSLKSFEAQKKIYSINMLPNLLDVVNLFTPVFVGLRNLIVIPASYFAMDFFGSDMAPNVVNYARMGIVFTHELLHSLSGGGQFFDKLGYFFWDYNSEIQDEYQKREQCFYDQYTNYTFDGKPLIQQESQAENTADNGGVILAYEDYLRWYTDSDRPQMERDMETLPNLNFTNKQLYFVTYAQAWCTHYSAEVREEYAKKTHSPNEFRAYVPLTNFREFSKEFNCPKGSAMNPKKKCYLN